MARPAQQAIARGLAYAPYADLIWCETGHPDLEDAKKFADAIHAKFPGKMLAYNCSPSFHWKSKLDDATIAKFQRDLGAMSHEAVQMAAYVALQEAVFAGEKDGHTITGGTSPTTAMKSSTEAEQLKANPLETTDCCNTAGAAATQPVSSGAAWPAGLLPPHSSLLTRHATCEAPGRDSAATVST